MTSHSPVRTKRRSSIPAENQPLVDDPARPPPSLASTGAYPPHRSALREAAYEVAVRAVYALGRGVDAYVPRCVGIALVGGCVLTLATYSHFVFGAPLWLVALTTAAGTASGIGWILLTQQPNES